MAEEPIELREEIADHRSRLSDTVDQIENRVRPSRMLSRRRDRVRTWMSDTADRVLGERDPDLDRSSIPAIQTSGPGEHYAAPMPARAATIDRETGETRVSLTLTLDGTGEKEVNTGVGFLDHMLELLARHGLFDLRVAAEGDTRVDFHHTTEDVGICLGRALAEAVGDKAGITRYGSAVLPMEDALVTVAVDLSGRPMLVWDVAFPAQKVGDFDTELVREFWQAVANEARCNLHVVLHHGLNAHHVAEAVFKGAARALRQAAAPDPRQPGIPSSKGVL